MMRLFRKIRWQILSRLVLVVGLLFVGLHYAADAIILTNFRALELRSGEAEMGRVLNVLNGDIESLRNAVTNEARWDEAYQFIQQPSAGFIKTNTVTLSDLNLDFLLYLDPAGRVVFGKERNPVTGIEEPLRADVQATLTGQSRIWGLTTPESGAQGLLLIGPRPALLATQPIVTSEGKGPVRGVLVFGRWFESGTLTLLSQKVKHSLSLLPVAVNPSQSVPLQVVPLDPERLRGQLLLKDLDARPILSLVAELPRDIYRQGKRSVDYFIFWFFVGTACSVLFIYRLIDKGLTAEEEASAKLQYLACHDALTDLPNRPFLRDFVDKTLSNTRRGHHHAALLCMDLDRFKQVNDTYGHSQGDQLLVAVSNWLKGKIRHGDLVARIGGDEFIIFLPSLKGQLEARIVAQKLLEIGNHPFRISDNQVFVSISIGIAIFPEDGNDLETLQKKADLAMYAAKRSGRNGYQFISAEMNQRVLRQNQMESAMRHAILHNEFYLVYHPQVDLVTGSVCGAEALLRWRSPVHGELTPDQFIPVAEESGLIHALGEWVLTAACRQLQAWQQSGCAPLRIAINFSGIELKRPEFLTRLDRILATTGIDPQWLEFELTESVLMDNVDGMQLLLEQLRARKISLSIDDFGTGYSSLSYLKNFPIQRVKIDRSFVQGLGENHKDLAIIKAIIAMAASLDLLVTAEGVETEGQLQLLHAHGCTEIQGYYFARPMLADDLEHYLRDGNLLSHKLLGRSGAAPDRLAEAVLRSPPCCLL